MADPLIHRAARLLALTSGCHGIPERCFRSHGIPLALCARCTGLGLGYVLAVPNIVAGFSLSPLFALGALALIGTDWVLPHLTGRDSSNCRRFIVGLLSGGLLAWWWYGFVHDLIDRIF